MAQSGTGTMTQAKGTYEIKEWDEKTWEGKDRKEQPGPKLTHAKVTQTFHGDIEAEATIQMMMAYRDDTSASYVGLMYVVGRIGKRSGSFVVEINGVYEDGAAKSVWTVVPGSGTDELRGLRGEGNPVAQHGSTQPFTFDYYFE